MTQSVMPTIVDVMRKQHADMLGAGVDEIKGEGEGQKRIMEHRKEREKNAARERRNALTRQRKGRLERRKNALCFAIEVKLIAFGAGCLTAQRAALALVERGLKLAQRWMQQYGYSYLEMRWV